ncbi:hypothetical protein [Streptomyces sp. CBMA156]|uniref:hypothetical protein n=1 Tax=Streptomyces sp. CBMA156 TaxID=1930280 RepID=UPI001661F292|nr:hypothetical protein [Streptomyces sp. CBMA156]MBD0673075.1 hypothetical protein [Streptomyces sp. CBMA156]
MSSIQKKQGVAVLAAASMLGAMAALIPAGDAFAGTVPIGSGIATSTGTIGPAAPGGAITQKQMIARAHDWIDNAVPYSQYASWQDNTVGGPYREDCSGFVSMAWGLKSSPTTQMLPNFSTVVAENISGNTSLQPGDALDYTADHVVLFDSWVNKSAGTFNYDAEHKPGRVTDQQQGSVYSSTLEGYPISYYEALRYKNIVPDTTSPTTSTSPVSMDANAGHVAFVDPSGNVMNDWVSNGAWQGPSGLGGKARSDSPVVLNANADHAFFIDPDGNVMNDWVSNGVWQGPSPIGGKARPGSSLTTNAAGTLVAFVDNNGNLANDWVSNGAWQGPSGLGGQARNDSPLAFNANGDHIFFIDPNGNVANDWVNNGTWQGPAGIGGQARPGSSIATDAAGTHVAFIDTYGSLANDWVNNGTWQGPSGLGGTSR